MLLFYSVSCLINVSTLLWLRQVRFGRVLFALSGLSLVGGVLAAAGLLAADWAVLVWQSLSWVVLLVGLGLPWFWVGGGVLAALLLGLLPGSPVVLLASWGLVTAVPIAATVALRQRARVSILTPREQIFRRVRAELTTESLISQKPVLDCLTDGVIVSALDGRVLYANQATAVILGIPLTQIEQQPMTEVLPGLRIPASRTGHIHRFEQNGRMIEGEMHFIFNEMGMAQETVTLLRDVTVHHHAEEARDNFLTTISHELRTPLTVIKGYIELIGNGLAGPISHQQKQFLVTIQRNVNRMVDLINNLIFVSTIKGGRLEQSTGLTDLRQLIPQIARELQPNAQEQSQQIVVDVDGRLEPIEADPIHMATVLEELMTNAIKYNRPGRTVHVNALLQVDLSQQQEFAVVNVRDEGVGIAIEDQGHIFDNFYRSDGSDVQVRAGGIGVGLSIVRALVEAYNGRIWFESALDHGSTFSFIVPTRQAAPLSGKE